VCAETNFVSGHQGANQTHRWRMYEAAPNCRVPDQRLNGCCAGASRFPEIPKCIKLSAFTHLYQAKPASLRGLARTGFDRDHILALARGRFLLFLAEDFYAVAY
jgi:hypothetical protein